MTLDMQKQALPDLRPRALAPAAPAPDPEGGAILVREVLTQISIST